jgi:hypothetical protein
MLNLNHDVIYLLRNVVNANEKTKLTSHDCANVNVSVYIDSAFQII